MNYYREPVTKEMPPQACAKSRRPSLTIQDFSIGQELGHGKFGKVYVAKHRATGMMFSLKVMDKNKVQSENYVEQVILEAKTQAQLDHPNIIKLYGVFDDNSYFYMLLELAVDKTLFHVISTRGALPESQALAIVREVAEGVHEMHLHRIIHRDIKPENITISFVPCLPGRTKTLRLRMERVLRQPSSPVRHCGVPVS
jgi:aurora kinase